MRQSYWTEAGTIALRDFDPAPLQPGWVRLQVAACGICGSDLHRMRDVGYFRAAGAVPGHELVGSVVTATTSGLPDALYALEPWVYCGRCDFCRGAKIEHCREGKLIGAQLPGGLADCLDVPVELLHPVDPSLSPREASLVEPLAVCVRCVRLAQLEFDSRVLVLGGGAIGLLAGLLARDQCAHVAISCRHPHQAAAARQLGLEPLAEADVDAFAKTYEPDVLIETVGGHADTLQQAIRCCRFGGRIVVVGLFTGESSIDARVLPMKELRIVGSKFYGMSEHGPVFRSAVDLLPRHRDAIKVLQTHAYPLAQIDAAFHTAFDKSSQAIKVTVLPA
jgi:threonine dehydrogenase-like Zn-dependent dehydrogenase